MKFSNQKVIRRSISTLAVVLLACIVLTATHRADGASQRSRLATLSFASSTHYPPFWRQRLLSLVGAPRSSQNLRFLYAWGTAEGGFSQWNPLNTTYVLPYGESWSYNNSTVQNYWRSTGGVSATGLTLTQSTYSCLIGAFQGAQLTAEQINSKCAAAIKTWGTDPSTIAKVLTQTP